MVLRRIGRSLSLPMTIPTFFMGYLLSKIQIKKGALVLKLRKSVPRRSALFALIPCGAPLNPSVIRGSIIYGLIIPRGEKSVKKADKQ